MTLEAAAVARSVALADVVYSSGRLCSRHRLCQEAVLASCSYHVIAGDALKLEACLPLSIRAGFYA